MKRLLTALLLPLLGNLPAAAAPPEVGLLVELRWVELPLSGAAQAGVRDGAVVVGTAGSVSPGGPAVVTSTARAAPQTLQRLTVLNGRPASLRLTRPEPLHWANAVVELAPDGQLRGIYADTRPPQRLLTQAFAVTPTWPGGRAPVRVSFSVEAGGGEFQSTLDLPLERWQTVARSGDTAAPSSRGSLGSQDAAGQTLRELQLRVSLQP